MKILVIEDEKELRESVVSYLEVEGYTCDQAPDFRTATDQIGLYEYNCILIDLNLPDGSGFDLISEVKHKGTNEGIIVVTARDAIEDRIKGLETGADDYLIKPFNLSELNARIKSVIRRTHFEGSNKITFNEIEVIPDEFKLFIKQKPVELTKKEFDLLLYFLSNKNRVITKESLGEHLWGDLAFSSGSLDFVYTHIKNLRKKLLDSGCKDYIRNIYGVGYKFNTDA